MINGVLCKLYLPDDEIRRIQMQPDPSLEWLREFVIKCMEHSESNEQNHPIVIRYQDDEGDWLNVDTILEWQEAKRVASLVPIFRIKVELSPKEHKEELESVSLPTQVEPAVTEIPKEDSIPQDLSQTVNISDSFLFDDDDEIEEIFHNTQVVALSPISTQSPLNVDIANAPILSPLSTTDEDESIVERVNTPLLSELEPTAPKQDFEYLLATHDDEQKYSEQLTELFLMGFTDRERNIELLEENNGDLENTLNAFLNE
jgi:hypothetical protein